MFVSTDRVYMGTNRQNQINLRGDDILSAIVRSQHDRQWIIFGLQMLYAVNAVLIFRFSKGMSWPSLARSSIVLPICLYLMVATWCLLKSQKRPLLTYEVIVSIALDFWISADVLLHSAGADGGRSESFFFFLFPLIAIRTLHFNPQFVIIAGCMAALVSFAELIGGIQAAPKAFAGGLKASGLALLVTSGDKLISLAVVTGVLAVAMREARRHLFTSTIRGAAGKGLAKMVGSNVAKEVLFSRNTTPGKGKRQHAAILIVDLQGFTKLSHQADPSDVLALLANYQQLVEPVILKHGGQIDKFMGDGILAHFGAMDSSPTFAAQALACMESILHAMDHWNYQRFQNGRPTLLPRVACDVGTVVAGIVGGSSKMEFTIIGDPVNIASKLEKYSKKLEARSITSLRAFQVARKQGYSPQETPKMHRECMIDGVREPLDLVVLSPQKHYSQQKTKIASSGPKKAVS